MADSGNGSFKDVVDAAVANGKKLKLTFASDGGKAVQELQRLIEGGFISMSSIEERSLKADASTHSGGGTYVIQLTDRFSSKRGVFEKKILTGVEALVSVAS